MARHRHNQPNPARHRQTPTPLRNHHQRYLRRHYLLRQRPTQARLFTRNDLRTPIYPFSNAFIPVAAGTAAWSFTPNVVSIKPGETIGIQTRLMSSEFLPLNAHFERLAIVAPTP